MKSQTTIEVHGPAVREIRIRSGMGVLELAKSVGVQRPYITKLELGHSRRVSPKVFNGLIAALGVEDRRAILVNPYGASEDVEDLLHVALIQIDEREGAAADRVIEQFAAGQFMLEIDEAAALDMVVTLGQGRRKLWRDFTASDLDELDRLRYKNVASAQAAYNRWRGHYDSLMPQLLTAGTVENLASSVGMTPTTRTPESAAEQGRTDSGSTSTHSTDLFTAERVQAGGPAPEQALSGGSLATPAAPPVHPVGAWKGWR